MLYMQYVINIIIILILIIYDELEKTIKIQKAHD